MLRHRGSTALAVVAVVLAAAICVAAGYYQQFAATQQAAARRAVLANASLQDELARLRDRIGANTQSLNLAQRHLAALKDTTNQQLAASQQAATSKADRIAQLAGALDQAQQELHLTEAQRVTLMARLSKAETDRVGVDQWQRKVEQLTADRDQAVAERDRLRNRLGELERRLSLQTHQPLPPVAAIAPPAAAPAPPRQVAIVVPQRPEPTIATVRPERTTTVAPGRIAQFERVLASAGVDVERLFREFGVQDGLGGPFVPMPRGGLPEGNVSAARLAALPGLVKSLPVLAPMSDYRETSPFGERRDPFNGRPAFHPGIDFAAPYGTPVYATGPGVVTYAGYRSDYGKIVEINHGHGIVSRYGHLARYVVLVGEHVKAGAQIGYEGSTGRSTGPHVIYEIDVNGEPQDPAKFLELAHLVVPAPR
jgi:murein DD-endopeptidase MepM/ murein hydrolase activator NlpD